MNKYRVVEFLTDHTNIVYYILNYYAKIKKWHNTESTTYIVQFRLTPHGTISFVSL